MKALIFDVDGTLAETERLHLAAFNLAFAKESLDWRWDQELYRELLKVTGGKERMRAHASAIAWPARDIPESRISRLHASKNEIFGELVARGECELRPGVERLLRGAHARGLRLAICTTTSRVNVLALLDSTLGAADADLFEVIVCGEDVRAKKPDPEAYALVLDRLGLEAGDCLAFEDSRNGLRAAMAAGLRTIITPSEYTSHETFDGAWRILPDLTSFELPGLA